MNKKVYAQNIFLKLFKFESKRYFTNAALLIIACIVPILLITTLLGSLLPVLFMGAELNDINVALFNEDPTFETNMIVSHLTESDSVEDFVNVIDVKTMDEGMEMLEANEASALIHIPADLQDNLYHGISQTISFYAGNTDKQVANLLYDMLAGGLSNINQAQKSVDIVYYAMRDMGYERAEAAAQYTTMAEKLFTSIISRSNIYIDYNEVSATGDYLNIEYYLISTLLLCMFFISLSICAKFASDKNSGILDRGGFHLSSFSYIAAKTLSGALFLLLPTCVTVIYVFILTGSFGLFSGSVGLLIITIIMSCIYFAVIMISVGAFSKSTTSAIWVGFSLALAVSMISGIFIPRNLMPRSVAAAAEITGLPAIVRLYGASVFGVKNSSTFIDLLKLFALSIVVFIGSYLKTRKRFVKR